MYKFKVYSLLNQVYIFNCTIACYVLLARSYKDVSSMKGYGMCTGSSPRANRSNPPQADLAAR